MPIFFISKSLFEVEPRFTRLEQVALTLRVVRWAIELSKFNILFKPRLELKGQVLDDFLVEIPQQEMEPNSSGWWTLNVDGTS